MRRFRCIALQGSSRGLLPPLLLFVFLITTSGIPALAADVSAACSSPVARVVSIQGSLELLRARQNEWLADSRRVTLEQVAATPILARLWQNALAMFGPLL